MIHFTADNHFKHTNIIKYCNRPFSSVEEMDDTMLTNWNSTVSPGDTVYHLGDLAFGPADYIQELISKLNGQIIMVGGNHDRRRAAIRRAGVELENQLCINIDGRRLFLRHRPACDRSYWQGADFHICGHVHDAWKIRYAYGKAGVIINVGVDVWEFKPVSSNDVLKCLV